MTNHLVNQTMPEGERSRLAAYYTKGLALSGDAPCVLRPDISPQVAIGLGIDTTKPLTKKQINGLLSGHRTDGEKIQGKKYAKELDHGVNEKTGERKTSGPIGSYDFCPQPHKSISISFAFAPPAEQALIFNAHLDAARYAVAYIAKHIGVCRLGEGGKDGEVRGDVAWLEFTHLTERRIKLADNSELPGDPGLHTHFLIPSAVFGPEGKVGSLHTARVRGLISEASPVYNARLAQNLRDCDMNAVLDHKLKACVMPDIPENVCKMFSKRSEGIDASAQQTAKQRGEDWNALTPEQKEARRESAGRSLKWSNKGNKDDIANFDHWAQQAKEIGWQVPQSFQTLKHTPELTDEQRIRQAYEIALPFLAEKLDRSATVTRWDVRAAAGYGLIQTGFKGIRDINAVTKLMREEGVIQYGEKTELVWGEDNGRWHEKITTGLHESQEKEFAQLARAAADDRSSAIPEKLLTRKAQESGLDFSDEHGKAQLAMLNRLGTDGRFTVAIAAAGAGKGAAAGILVAAWREQGREVYGVSVAHRQASELTKAGIAEDHVTALSGPRMPNARTFLEAAQAGNLNLGPNTVVVVDEVAQLGTRQGLELLRLRAKHNFTLVALGDDRQCSSIAAGAIVDLTRRALGPERVPEILTTRRQRTERERRVVSLLREGRAKEAIDMKRADGTAIMVAGGYRETIAETAKAYVGRLRETGEAPGIGTPTNRDAHEISLAIRAERRSMGMLGQDVKHISAVGQEGHEYTMGVALGEHVRLFHKVRTTTGSIGNNGDVLEVLAIDRGSLTVRNPRTSKEGCIPWKNLTRADGKIRLGYGYALTINAAQGLTKGGFIVSMPSGSRAIDGNDAYSAGTRQRDWSCIITSGQAENAEVRQSRTLNDTRAITLDDQWGNVGRHFAQQTVKDLALNLLDKLTEVHRGSVLGFAKQLRPAEQRVSAGQAPSHAHEKIRARQVTPVVQRAAQYVHELHQRVQPIMQRVIPRERAHERQQQRQGPSMTM